MDNQADPLSQIDAEIEKLRHQKPNDAADCLASTGNGESVLPL